MKSPETRIIISGGGTGGHLFPALSIAEALKKLRPTVKILFVGALGKIEMEKVPLAGYEIEGLDIRGLQRSFSLENLKFPLRLIKSLIRSFRILKQFKPNVAVGVGGYASGPLLFAAQRKNIPCLIQEQNSYPGITNKLLAKGASAICVAYSGMERFFPSEKIRLMGNPVRVGIAQSKISRMEACASFGLDESKKVLLIIGGSLGARTLNESVIHAIEKIDLKNNQVLWQTGRFYYKDILSRLEGINLKGVDLEDVNLEDVDLKDVDLKDVNLKDVKLKGVDLEDVNLQDVNLEDINHKRSKNQSGIIIREFIDRMDLAYAASDVIISRSGAGTISELAFTGKPVILVPSPNVAEDHQTHNANALVKENAALLVKDADAQGQLIDTAIALIADEERCRALGANLLRQAYPHSADEIAAEILKLADKPKA